MKLSHKIIMYMLIATAFAIFVSCEEQYIEPAVYAVEDFNKPLPKMLIDNLYVEAEVNYPQKNIYPTYELRDFELSQDDLERALFTEAIQNNTISVEITDTDMVLESMNGEYAFYSGSSLFYMNTDNFNRLSNIKRIIDSCINEGVEGYEKEFEFMSSSEAEDISLKFLGLLNPVGEAKLKSITAFDYSSLLEQQEILKKTEGILATDPEYELYYVNDLYSEDNYYVLTFYFSIDNIEIYNTLSEPEIKVSYDSWTAPQAMEYEVVISQDGIVFLTMDSLYRDSNVQKSQEKAIITIEAALQLLVEKYSLVILTDELTVKKIWLEYIPITETNWTGELGVLLVPYWCFQLENEENGVVIAERFNAYNGKDLAYDS